PAGARDADGDLRLRIRLLELLRDGLGNGVDSARPVDAERSLDGAGARAEASTCDQGGGQNAPNSVHCRASSDSWRLPASRRTWPPRPQSTTPNQAVLVAYRYRYVNGR